MISPVFVARMLYGLPFTVRLETGVENQPPLVTLKKKKPDFTMGIVFFSKGYPMNLILNSFVDLLLQCHGKKWLILQGFTVRFNVVFDSRVRMQNKM